MAGVEMILMFGHSPPIFTDPIPVTDWSAEKDIGDSWLGDYNSCSPLMSLDGVGESWRVPIE